MKINFGTKKSCLPYVNKLVSVKLVGKKSGGLTSIMGKKNGLGHGGGSRQRDCLCGSQKKGVIVSTKELRTCIVTSKRRVFHKKYEKVLTVTKRVVVHDPYQVALLRQKVEIFSTRLISKQKTWYLTPRTKLITLLKTTRK